MALRLGNITFDCDDPRRVAAFWAVALGEPIDGEGSDEFCSIGIGRAEVRPKWLFLKVPEAKTAKNRMHIDLTSVDRDVDVERLVAAGATRIADKAEWGINWTVMSDVEGNEFCITAHP